VKNISKQETVTRKIIFVEISEVEPNVFNPNILDEEKRLELKRLMAKTTPREFFLKDPLWASPYDVFYGSKLAPVKKKHVGYVFIDGQHRWLNAKELGWEEVGLDIEPVTEVEARQRCYSKNYLRGQTDPLKEANLFKAEVDGGMTQEAVAEKYFKDPSYVSSSLSLLQLPESVQQMLYIEEDEEKTPLTKSHLIQLAGLPEENAIELADAASEGSWSVSDLKENVRRVEEKIEEERARAEAMSHFVLRTCPICDEPGVINRNLVSMSCPNYYTHYIKLKVRNSDSLNWEPLDTKESMMKKVIALDNGKKFSLAKILAGEGRTKGSPIKRKPNWFKYEKTVDEIMTRIHSYAYEILVANRGNIVLDEIQVTGDLKEGPKESYGWHNFSIKTNDGGISVKIGDKSLWINFEKKEWKRGNFKTRINIGGITDDDPKAPEKLKDVQLWMDKLMRLEAKVEDYPFHIAERRITTATASEEEPEVEDLDPEEDISSLGEDKEEDEE